MLYIVIMKNTILLAKIENVKKKKVVINMFATKFT